MGALLCPTYGSFRHSKLVTVASSTSGSRTTSMAVASSSLVDKSELTMKVDGSWDPRLRRIGCGAVLLDVTRPWISGILSSHGNGSAFIVLRFFL